MVASSAAGAAAGAQQTRAATWLAHYGSAALGGARGCGWLGAAWILTAVRVLDLRLLGRTEACNGTEPLIR
eukprot:SAG25_NODE_4718_length_761_cov_2.081571_2_plen_71_part_00